jgi:multidrug transporter EmrE-like cation transporter
MRMANLRRTSAPLAAITAAAFAMTTLNANVARADEVSPDGKGIVGGAFLGAEIVTIPMALFQVKPGWAYAVGGGLGAIGGGVGGYFIERASFSSDGRVPMYMLAGGLGLIIPAVVLILNATRYQPSEGATEDNAPTNGPPADPGKIGGSVVLEGGGSSTPAPAPSSPPTTTPPPATTTPAPSGGGTPPAIPMSLLDLHHRAGMRMGIPVPEVRDSYTAAERKAMGLPQVSELRVPLFHATF